MGRPWHGSARSVINCCVRIAAPLLLAEAHPESVTVRHVNGSPEVRVGRRRIRWRRVAVRRGVGDADAMRRWSERRPGPVAQAVEHPALYGEDADRNLPAHSSTRRRPPSINRRLTRAFAALTAHSLQRLQGVDWLDRLVPLCPRNPRVRARRSGGLRKRARGRRAEPTPAAAAQGRGERLTRSPSRAPHDLLMIGA